jgi:hypothetical protein
MFQGCYAKLVARIVLPGRHAPAHIQPLPLYIEVTALKGRPSLFWGAVWLLAFTLILGPTAAIAQQTATPSECVACHANLKKLIRLCWEVEKIKPKLAQSAETSGEG